MRSRLRFLRTNLLLGALVACGAGSQAWASSPAGWTYVDAAGTVHAFAQADDCDNNVTDGGAIGEDVRGCPNPTYQPAALTNVTLPSGGTGELEYAWMTTTTDPASVGAVDWTLIPNTNSPDYTPSPLSQTAYFMRCARRAGCTAYAGETNYVTVTLDCCDNVTGGGTIDGDEEACGTPYDPGVLRNLGPATGGSNATEYQWYVSTTSDVYAVGDAAWTAIAGATAATYNPDPIATVTHYVRTAKKEGCADVGAFSNVVTVAARPLPTLSGTTEDPSCNGQADGSIAASVDEAAEPFTVRWLDDASAGLTRSGLPEGTYTLEATDAFGCVGTQTFELVAPESLTVAATAEVDDCAFADDAVLTAVASGGTEPYGYAWSNGATTDVVTGQPAGTYDVTVVDANGCTGDARVEVAPPPAFNATVAFTDPNCYQPDGTIDVTPAGGTAPYAYAWSHDPDLTGGSATGLAGGDYAITVTDANGCEADVAAALDDTPDITLELATEDVSCNAAADGEIGSTVSGGTPPYTYRWSNGATTPDLTGVGPGTYTLSVTDDQGCVRDASATVDEPTSLTASIGAVQPLCREDGGTLTAQMSGGAPPYTFDWGATGRAGEMELTGVPPGAYELNVTDDNGCTASATATVEDVPLLELGGSAQDATCPNATDGSATVTVSGGQASYAYRWNDPANQTTATAANLAAGVYTVEVTDDRGCAKTLDVEVANQSTGPRIGSEVTDLGCSDDASGAIDVTVTEGLAPFTFAWVDDGTPSAVTSEDRTGLPAGTYEVTVTDAAGCEVAETFTLSEPEPLLASVDVIQPICREDGGTLTAQISGGTPPYTFDWDPVGRSGETVLAGMPGGDYELNVTDDNGCTVSARATVEDVPLLELSGTAVDATCPNATDGSATVSVSGGQASYAYRWNDPANQTTATAANLAAGVYTVEVTDDRGCAKTLDVEVANQSTGPRIGSEVTDLGCSDDASGAIDVTVTEGLAPFTFAWVDDGTPSAVTSEDRTGLPAGTYEVTVTDAAGCEDTGTFTLTEPEELTVVGVPTSSYPRYFNVSRFEATDGAARSTTTGGTPPYTYAWTQGGTPVATGASATGLGGGLTTVTVTDANGCVATHDTTLVEPSMISDFVWEDEDGDGIQDADEPGLENVEIRLTGRDFNGFSVNFTVFSDENGAYRLDRLPISQGAYRIFMLVPNEDDYLFSPADQGSDDALDSDFDPATRQIRREVVAHGTADYDTDAGFIPRDNTISIGDAVWYDADHDGLRDPHELPVQGVTFRLYRVVDNLLVSETVSNENGVYAFEDVVPGEYYIEADQFTSSIARDFVVTLANVGSDEALESDFDPTTQRTLNFSVASSDGDIDDIDLGLHEDCPALADGGRIAGDEDVCVSELPAEITSVEVPDDANRYQWYISDVPNYEGPNDPNWFIINGASSRRYQPSVLATTKYYIRLARARGCLRDFTGASNVVRKRAIPAPVARIASARTSDENENNGRTIFMCDDETLTATAELVNGASYFWDFGADATPRYDTGDVAGPISYNQDGTYDFYLRVVNPSGCEDTDRFRVNVQDCANVGRVADVNAAPETSGNVVEWSAMTYRAGAYFEVQRATAAADFEPIDRVSARAIGELVEYAYTDRFAPAGELAYRVVHAAPAFAPTVSDAVHLVGEREDLLARAYPNPVAGELTLEVAAVTPGETRFELTNAYGALVRVGLVESGLHTLNLRDLPAGSYHLRVIAANGDAAVRTVLKR